jgi:uncharacterized protein (DUF488 family)
MTHIPDIACTWGVNPLRELQKVMADGLRRRPRCRSPRPALEKWLPDRGVDYRREPRLGGRRRTSPGSANMALEHPSFRGYADYMTSPEFAEARAQLVIDARERRTVIMCAASVWWRCHRRLIADSVMLLDRLAVTHLFHDGRLVPHTPMPVARVDGLHLVYDLMADAPLPI